MNKKVENKQTSRVDNFKLPKFLRLAKGTMFLDTEGEDASGVKLYLTKEQFVGRKVVFSDKKNSAGFLDVKDTDIPKDQYDNKNLSNFGTIKADLPWFFDTTKIDPSKLSRIITAYKYGILVEADPNNPPKEVEEKDLKKSREFDIDDKGKRIFIGKNKEMFSKLQNMNFKSLRDFVNSFPKTNTAKENLMDLYNYELRGHNPLNRTRIEVVQLIKEKLKEYGPGISSIRVNEE